MTHLIINSVLFLVAIFAPVTAPQPVVPPITHQPHLVGAARLEQISEHRMDRIQFKLAILRNRPGHFQPVSE